MRRRAQGTRGRSRKRPVGGRSRPCNAGTAVTHVPLDSERDRQTRLSSASRRRLQVQQVYRGWLLPSSGSLVSSSSECRHRTATLPMVAAARLDLRAGRCVPLRRRFVARAAERLGRCLHFAEHLRDIDDDMIHGVSQHQDRNRIATEVINIFRRHVRLTLQERCELVWKRVRPK